MASLYRKWRSRSFDDLVGQEHVVRTLRNAVANDRVAHAYLFTGPRGTGKTSTARILAKALNCLNPEGGNPCNRCQNCVAANEGRALDVIEIDAASNTGVDDVRDLRERVAYAASEGRFKVYIIDEVHRLSGSAFDAFLKTLEEPPAHVVFVFASTEPHKVPATIMSRCQRFDFKRMSQAQTVEHVRHIAAEEQIEIADDAIALIAQSAGGSMRDALGLLDQVAAYATGPIDAAVTRAALGLADPTLVARLADSLLDGAVGQGLTEAATFVDNGGDPGQLLAELIDYWRALLLRVTGAGHVESVVDPALTSHVDRHAGRVRERQAVAVLDALTAAEFSPKYDIPPLLPFELGFVRAALALQQPPAIAQPQASPAARPEPAVSRTAPQRRVREATPVPPSTPVERVEPPPTARNESTATEREGPPVPALDDLPPAAAVLPPSNGSTTDLTGLHARITEAMRDRSKSLQAVLRSGYVLAVRDGEVTIGFSGDWHVNQINEVQKRRLVEEAVSELLGASYRVKCVKVTRDEVKAALGEEAVPEDDGFVEAAAERLRRFHARELGNGIS